MTLDDRLRAASRRRLEDTRRRMEAEGAPPIAALSSKSERADGAEDRFPLGRLVAVAAATLVAVAVGGLVVGAASSRNGTAPAGEVAEPVDERDGDATIDGPTGERDEADGDGPTPTVVVEGDQATGTDSTESSGSTGSTGDGPVDDPVDDTAESAAGSTEPTGDGTEDGSGPVGDVGRPAQEPVATAVSDVCASGRRAALEDATLSYVEGLGWNRLDDLVDEQDGPFRFVGWEPGHPDPVTVEVRPAAPIEVDSIHLALDPSGPVGGVIEIELLVEGDDDPEADAITMELAGVGGWAVHELGQPRRIQALTIRRTAAESNVMELLVCVAG